MKIKIKTKRSAAKRFSFTANGKIKRKKAFLRHILTKKSSGLKRRLRKAGLVNPFDIKRVQRMLPNR